MTAKPKSELMARLRAKRRAKGLVPVTVWVPEADAEKIRALAVKLTAARSKHTHSGSA